MRNNLTGWLLGSGAISRELRETRAAWEDSQAHWRASPLAKETTFDLVLPILQDAMRANGRAPASPMLGAAGVAIERLFDAEEAGEIKPCWDVIGEDVRVAVEFRQMLVRRKRWATQFDRTYGSFRRIAASGVEALFKALPESCYGDLDDRKGDTFEVPVLDLLDDPPAIIERLLMLPYDDESFRLDLFFRLRDLTAGNLLVASGFMRNDNIHERSAKLVLPTRQKQKTGAELAELYLSGSPLKELLEVPVPFHIPQEVRFEHCHIVGGTGHGKTQLMQKMIHADLLASKDDGRSVVVIDSQGDLINKLVHLELFDPDGPDSLADRLVVIDPADVEYPAALNLFDAHLARLEQYGPADKERVLNGVIELYELFFGAFLGAELTQKQGVIFKYLARLMLAIPNATIYTLMEIMEDGKRFGEYMALLDGSARYFFETEFFHPSFAATKKQVLRRLWGVLSTPAFERMFTQPQNKLDLFAAMNQGNIILVSTAKDLLKREGSQLLGRFFIAMLTQAALERSTLPERLRNPVSVYVDEAQEYFDDNIETILNQARKYCVGLTLAHQTLDQLSPQLRSALFANTSLKCAGGVSAKDARTLADELHTTAAFIEGMRRRGERSEFAAWVKHRTGQAIRLSVELGFLERQPTLTEEAFDELIGRNRIRYCGTLAAASKFQRPAPPRTKSGPFGEETPSAKPSQAASGPEWNEADAPGHGLDIEPSPQTSPPAEARPAPTPSWDAVMVPLPEKLLGKGGSKHRYLQAMVKELAEANGLKATIEAPLPNGGQVDVLIERDRILAGVEISVYTPADHECENLLKCLGAEVPRVAVVLVKSKASQSHYRAALLDAIGDQDRERVTFLTPEELPDFIAQLAPPPEPEEKIVRGYRVKRVFSTVAPEEARVRRDALARLIAKSLGRQGFSKD